MWEFVETAWIIQEFSWWSCLVTLQKEGVPESFFLQFAALPTLEEADAAGRALAEKKNAEDQDRQLIAAASAQG